MNNRGILTEYASVLNAAFHAVDWLVVVASGWLAHRIYLGTFTLSAQQYQLLVIVLLLTAWIFPMFRLYEAWRGVSIIDETYAISLAWGTVLLAVMVLAFVSKSNEHYSRGWLASWALIGWSALVIIRTLLRITLHQMRRRGFNKKRVIIAGTVELCTEVARRIRATPWMGLDMVAYFHANGGPKDASIPDVPHVGCLDAIADYVATNDIEQVWIALPLGNEKKLRYLLHLLRNSTVDIRFIPDLHDLRLLNHSITDIAGLPVINMSVTPMAGINVLIKFLEDRIIATLILLLISPLMLLIAIGVRLSSPGPVIFKQLRYGWDGKPIEIYKFRSMKPHTEENGTVTQACNGDSRITGFGAFLRHSSLDELPQFINVIQGRMSIVGPRPHAVAHNEQYKDLVDSYMKRHKVKPGITGWAQVNGWRGETDTLEKMQKRVEYDLYYIEHWSPWFDVKIIALTILTGFANRNAY